MSAKSDYVGRKPVLWAATLVRALTMVLFATAGGVGSLIAARIVQNLATGSAVGAVGAAMLDIDRERGTFSAFERYPIAARARSDWHTAGRKHPCRRDRRLVL